ncbi:MAG: DUF4114 domain-containing protein [Myxococcota bacterium]
MLLPLLVACTEYGYSDGKDHAGGDGDGDGAGTDTGGTGDGGPGDGDGDDGDDRCYEPEHGYEQNPAARLFTTDATTPVTVTFTFSDTDYQDDLYLDAPATALLARAYVDPVGTTVTVGPFGEGEELIFGIDVLTTGAHYQSGPASRNDDGVVHVAATYEGGCAWAIGFEDLPGGGDLDFNDVVLRVEGMLRQED